MSEVKKLKIFLSPENIFFSWCDLLMVKVQLINMTLSLQSDEKTGKCYNLFFVIDDYQTELIDYDEWPKWGNWHIK